LYSKTDLIDSAPKFGATN